MQNAKIRDANTQIEKKRDAAKRLVELGQNLPNRDVNGKSDKELWHEHLVDKYG